MFPKGLDGLLLSDIQQLFIGFPRMTHEWKHEMYGDNYIIIYRFIEKKTALV